MRRGFVRELSENWVRLVRNEEGRAGENARVFLTFGAALRMLLAVCYVMNWRSYGLVSGFGGGGKSSIPGCEPLFSPCCCSIQRL